MKKITDKIQDYLKENNIPVAELGRRLGKTKNNMYQHFAQKDIKLNFYIEICDALELPHNYFLENDMPEGNNNMVSEAQETYKTANKNELIERIFEKNMSILEAQLDRKDNQIKFLEELNYEYRKSHNDK